MSQPSNPQSEKRQPKNLQSNQRLSPSTTVTSTFDRKADGESRTKKVLSVVRTFFSKIFVGRKRPPSEEPTTPPVDAPVATNRQPGLDCLRCSFRMTVAISMLLGSEPIVCPACRLKLHVDREKSNACLQKLAHLQSALDKVEEVQRQGRR